MALYALKIYASRSCVVSPLAINTSEYSLKRHLAVCSKRFSEYDDNEPVNESHKQIPRFASFKNDDDYASDNKALMPMQEDDDLYLQTINSDNERHSNVGSIADHNSNDDSSNVTLNDDWFSNDEKEKEQYDLDEWFEEQMDIDENGSEQSTGKDYNFV